MSDGFVTTKEKKTKNARDARRAIHDRHLVARAVAPSPLPRSHARVLSPRIAPSGELISRTFFAVISPKQTAILWVEFLAATTEGGAPPSRGNRVFLFLARQSRRARAPRGRG